MLFCFLKSNNNNYWPLSHPACHRPRTQKKFIIMSSADVESQQQRGPTDPSVQQAYVLGVPAPTSTAPAATDTNEPFSVFTTDPNQEPNTQAEIAATTCAFITLFFSWIPLIGCGNFLVHLGAPKGSARAMFGAISCLIASIVVLFFIIFAPIFWAT
jgi:hypothetical protein